MGNLAYDNDRFEVIDGKTIMMSPRSATDHNKVITNITYLFKSYLRGKRCINFSDDVDVHLDDKNIVIPDSMIICNKDIIKGDGIYGAPDLVVEVLSPSTANRDKKDKKALYEKHGVKEYWIVDSVSKSIEVYHLIDKKFILNQAYAVYPDWQWDKMSDTEKNEAVLMLRVSLYDDFAIDIRDIFENVE